MKSVILLIYMLEFGEEGRSTLVFVGVERKPTKKPNTARKRPSCLPLRKLASGTS